MEKISWAYEGYFLVKKLFETEKIRIFAMEGFEHNWDLIHEFEETDYIFISIGYNAIEGNFKHASLILNYLNPKLNPENIVFLCNTESQHTWSRKWGFGAIIYNHNSSLNENKFHINNDDLNRPYKMVINTRPEGWKRPFLAEKTRPLAIIKGYNFRKDDVFDLNTLAPEYINTDYLAIEEVDEIYNRSMVGGCFSEAEGACYASSEMLLSGLPVVSTESQGGRDFWYTKRNSIIVDSNADAVLIAADEAIHNLKNGLWSRAEIRDIHIEMSRIQRRTFISEVNKFMEKNNLPNNGSEILFKNFNHKLTNLVKADDISSLFNKNI
jgi:hypothetical protein